MRWKSRRSTKSTKWYKYLSTNYTLFFSPQLHSVRAASVISTSYFFQQISWWAGKKSAHTSQTPIRPELGKLRLANFYFQNLRWDHTPIARSAIQIPWLKGFHQLFVIELNSNGIFNSASMNQVATKLAIKLLGAFVGPHHTTLL